MNLFSLKGTLTVNNVDLVFSGDQTEDVNQGLYAQLEQHIIEAFKQATYGRSINEVKIPLTLKFNNLFGVFSLQSEEVVEQKFAKQSDLIEALIQSKLVSENVDFLTYLAQKEGSVGANVLGDALSDEPKQRTPVMFGCSKLWVLLKDGSEFKTRKDGSIRIKDVDETISQDQLMPWVESLVTSNQVEDLSGVFEVLHLGSEEPFVKFKVESLEHFQQLGQFFGKVMQSQLQPVLDPYALLQTRLQNFKQSELLGISKVVCGSVQIKTEDKTYYYVVDNNKFFKIVSGKRQDIISFEKWYEEIKQFYAEGYELEYPPVQFSNGYIEGFAVEYVNGVFEVANSPARLRAILKSCKEEQISKFINDVEQVKVQFEEVVDWLEEMQSEALEIAKPQSQIQAQESEEENEDDKNENEEVVEE